MLIKTKSLAIVLLGMFIGDSALGQHCGGPCEVPRGAVPRGSPWLRISSFWDSC